MVGRLYRCIGSIGRGARGADGCIGSMAGGAEASGGRGGMVSGSDGASGGGCLITSENREKHTGRKKLGGVNIAHTSSRSPWRPPPRVVGCSWNQGNTRPQEPSRSYRPGRRPNASRGSGQRKGVQSDCRLSEWPRMITSYNRRSVKQARHPCLWKFR